MVTKEHRAMRREQMERWLASDGMTVEEWCRLNRMSTSTFYLWLNKFREEEPGSFGQKAAKGWVGIAREERRDSLALAVVPAADAAVPAKRAGRGQTDDGGDAKARIQRRAKPITVVANGATVTIPAGSDAAEIAAVIGAVMEK